MNGAPHVLVDNSGLPGAPDQAAAEEGDEEGDAVVQLDAGARHVELVAEPVDVEEGGRELVEDEGRGVEVEEGSLLAGLVSDCQGRSGGEGEGQRYVRIQRSRLQER